MATWGLLFAALLSVTYFNSRLLQKRNDLYVRLTEVDDCFENTLLAMQNSHIAQEGTSGYQRALKLLDSTEQLADRLHQAMGLNQGQVLELSALRPILQQLELCNNTGQAAWTQMAMLMQRIRPKLMEEGGASLRFLCDMETTRALAGEYYVHMDFSRLDQGYAMVQEMRARIPASVAGSVAEWIDLYERVVGNIREGQSARDRMKELQANEQRTLSQIKLELQDGILKQQYKVGLLILFTLFPLLFIGWVFSRTLSAGIVRQILRVSDICDEAAKGDFAMGADRADVPWRDELGHLARSVQTMCRRIREVVVPIQESSHQLASAGDQQKKISVSLSTGSNAQAASAEEMSSAMEQLSANIDRNAEVAQAAQRIVERVRENVMEIASKSQQANGAVNDISQRTAIINEIAAQTNILALNAAVEAARAGEHGRGFAVVAAEVRKLAERSKSAAQEVEALAEQVVTSVHSVGAHIETVLPDVAQAADNMQEIAHSSAEQRAGANQINDAIAQLNEVINRNAQVSDDIASSSNGLSGQADRLAQALSYFQV